MSTSECPRWPSCGRRSSAIINNTFLLPRGLLSSRCCLNARVVARRAMRRRMVPRCKVWLLGFGRLRASGRAAAASACRGCAVVAVKYAWWARTCARIALHSSQGRPCKGVQLAACKTLALAKRPRSGFWHRRAAPERPDDTQDDPHALRRLRHRAWAILGQEMRPLQHTLLRA